MGWWKSIFSGKDKEEVPEEIEEIPTTSPISDKYDAEFHNPRLNCFYCKQIIESGKVKFFRAPGQTEDSAFHKRCFKKMKKGAWNCMDKI